ncbi:hypothetical protein ND748_06340 [Frankia sp. AiPs1]|uniref:hypothetical protein n=1 Tax=Frankia sp. AiPs1 TaxID=573493 RepID=UPI002044C5D3|nr:hypothetical protein [Frankia sp. AiPs1]MCM3921295.1 hypothetical protein [Frankia sp. AiPs1]
MSDNVMYDSPTEFLHEAANSGDQCVAQSVRPNDDGTFDVSCSCGRWTASAPAMEEGLRLARVHTGSH